MASALYGEILLLRQEAARVANTVSHWHTDGVYGRRDSMILESDIQPFMPSDSILYPALAGKIGLLPSKIVLAITKFHKDYKDLKDSLLLITDRP